MIIVKQQYALKNRKGSQKKINFACSRVLKGIEILVLKFNFLVRKGHSLF